VRAEEVDSVVRLSSPCAMNALDDLPRRDLDSDALVSGGGRDSSSAVEKTPEFLADLARVRRPVEVPEPEPVSGSMMCQE
jgi:hypothetical protein